MRKILNNPSGIQFVDRLSGGRKLRNMAVMCRNYLKCHSYVWASRFSV